MREARDTLLVDAKNLIYRAHFSHKGLTGTDGFPTSALFGGPNMLLDVLKKTKYPDVIICWDGDIPIPEVGLPGRTPQTWRHQFFADYKGNRKPNDDHRNAIMQAPQLSEMFHWFGFQQIGCPTIEADDLIGMLTPMLHRRKFNKRVYIFSNDKDLLQVATDPRTYCVIPDRKKGGNLYLDRDDIVERYGMTPDQVCLTKALAGDSSDNYKGLHMVGPVKALAYISRGVNPAFKYFRSHPKSVQEEFPFLEEEWNTVHTCYLLAKIPTTSKYPYFLPGFGVMAQARMVDVVRNRRRRMSQKNYNIRKRKFERLCVTHGMKMLLARRNELFRGIEIEG